MCLLAVRLFGKFQVQHGGVVLENPNTCKVQELFAYLLLYRDRPHTREALAGLLWPRSTSDQARKYLRDTLWKLQMTFDSARNTQSSCILLVDPDWVQLNPKANLWIDVAVFERACAHVRKMRGHEFAEYDQQMVQEALKLYQGDLLEGWYHDWCLFERERLQHLYLLLLEKEMDYCAAHDEYEIGLECGVAALRCDVAHERIHRRLMRLHYRAGNRCAALRQYERCVTLLREELGVDPSARTVTLYEEIRSDRLRGPEATIAQSNEVTSGRAPPSLSQTLYHLRQLQLLFSKVEDQLQETIQTIEVTLKVPD